MSLGFINHQGQKIDIFSGSRLIMTYHYDNVNAKSYFHPLNLPNGSTLTLDSPYDHPWHHGLFFTWKFINGKNYWEDNLPDHERGRMTTVGDVSVVSNERTCAVKQQLIWHDFDQSVLMDETRNIEIVCQGDSNAYLIMFDMKFQARERVVLERVSPNEKDWGGYAGLSFRPVRSMAMPRVINSEHAEEVSNTHGKAARWCDYSGRLDGGANLTGGVTLLDHRDNVRHPSPYYVFDRQPLQFLQAAFLYNEPYTIEPCSSLRLKYGVYVHEGIPSHDQLEQAYKEYLK